MSKEDENLFDGLTIMSPEEIESSMGTTEETEESTSLETSNEEEVENEEVEETDGLTITTPVPSTEEVPTDESEIDDEGDDKPTVYSAFIKEMINEGVISGPKEEEELEALLKDASVDTIKDLMKKTVDSSFEAKQESWKQGLSPEKKKFLEIEGAFTETDQAIQMAQRLEFFENVSEDVVKEDENLQKNLYFEYLKTKGFSEAEAVEAINEASAIDKLEEKALRAIPSLKKEANAYVDNSKKLKEEEVAKRTAQNEEAFNKLMSAVEEKESFIPNLNLNKVSRDKLKNNITASVYKDEDGRDYTSLMYKQMRNPAEFEMLINYYDTLGLFNLDKEGKFKPDITKLKNVAKTKAVSELDKVLKSEDAQPGKRRSVNSSEKSTGIIDFLERATGQQERRKRK